jgi:hypothetical protein
MSIGEVVFPALIAGAFMAIATEAGYRLGIVRGNLLQVDGEFALKLIGIKSRLGLVYTVGIAVHLITSAAFGAVLYIIAEITDIDVTSVRVVAPYVFVLWLAMLFSALPLAGQGFLGRRLADTIWIEQLGLHVIFGVVLWGVLTAL